MFEGLLPEDDSSSIPMSIAKRIITSGHDCWLDDIMLIGTIIYMWFKKKIIAKKDGLGGNL